ncbi:MAG: carbohydrate-binding family 9-like protein [Deferrisomatales bacterium]
MPPESHSPAPPPPAYTVTRARVRPDLSAGWDDPGWRGAPVLEVAQFRPEGSTHRPRTRARLGWDDAGLYGLFRVEDRFVRSVHTAYGDPVYQDSCVEAFLEPRPGRGYLNFEFNAGGALLASVVRDPARVPGGGLRDAAPLAAAEARRVEVRSSLPARVEPERAGPLTWTLSFFVPFGVFEAVLGRLGPVAGACWRGNLYKCGDLTSHPHWASWSPLDQRNFHRPTCFGTLRFAP